MRALRRRAQPNPVLLLLSRERIESNINSALLTVGAVLVLVLGYYFYGRVVERRCVQADGNRATPAVALRDGVDYEPARPLMLFGHHFTNIAGAGPIVAPVIAVAHFGWATTLGWILLGSIFVGGVHDYLSLMMSARSEGKNISEIAGRRVGKRAAAVLGLFTWLALLIVAVYLVGIRRPSRYATFPGFFVLVTTIAALLYQGYGFLLGPKRNLLLGGLSVLLVVLGLYVAVEAWQRIRGLTCAQPAQTMLASQAGKSGGDSFPGSL